jgi:hypothetical protein
LTRQCHYRRLEENRFASPAATAIKSWNFPFLQENGLINRANDNTP